MITQDDIIKMAREAGFSAKHTEAYFEWQIVALFHAAYAAGAAAERERIYSMGKDDRYSHQYVHSFLAAIRARSAK